MIVQLECKVSANEGHENLFSDGRVPPNFCKVRTIICKSKAKTQEKRKHFQTKRSETVSISKPNGARKEGASKPNGAKPQAFPNEVCP